MIYCRQVASIIPYLLEKAKLDHSTPVFGITPGAGQIEKYWNNKMRRSNPEETA